MTRRVGALEGARNGSHVAYLMELAGGYGGAALNGSGPFGSTGCQAARLILRSSMGANKFSIDLRSSWRLSAEPSKQDLASRRIYAKRYAS